MKMSEKLFERTVYVVVCGVVIPVVGTAYMCIGGALGAIDAMLFDDPIMEGPCATRFTELVDWACDKIINWANNEES